MRKLYNSKKIVTLVISTNKHQYKTICCNEIIFCNENIKREYDEIFHDVWYEYKNKNNKKCKNIDTYYDYLLMQQKRAKTYYELNISLNINLSEYDDILNIMNEIFVLLNIEYKQIRIVKAVLHICEQSINGFLYYPHLHIYFIPFAYNDSDKGIKIKNSYLLSLNQMGYTDYWNWRDNLYMRIIKILKKKER